MKSIDSEAVADGVHSALVTVLDAAGQFPVTRNEILDAIADGVRRAFVEVLGQRDFVKGSDVRSRPL
jgi:hypothetical protein